MGSMPRPGRSSSTLINLRELAGGPLAEEGKNMAALGRLSLRAVAGLLLVLGAITVSASLATAASGPAGVDPIIDYTNYPNGILPAGCGAQGDTLVNGEQFTVNGVSVGSLRELIVSPTDVVVMTWESFSAGCEGAGVSLSVKTAPSPDFNPGVDQYLAGFDYCGPGGPACTAPFRLTIDMRAIGGTTCYQLDANAGRPLEIVGPSGSYYSLNQPVNLLISALNGGSAPCQIVPCANAPAGSTIPAGTFACDRLQPTTTTTEQPPSPRPTTPTTCAPGQVLNGSGQCVAPTPTTCAAGQVLNGSGQCVAPTPTTCGVGQVLNAAGQCVGVAGITATTLRTCPAGQVLNAANQCVATAPIVTATRALPVTGRTTVPFLLTGAGLLAAGAVLLRLSVRTTVRA